MGKAQKKEAPVVTEGKAEKKAAELTAAQTKAVEALSTVSAKIRYLNEQGFSRGEIAKALGKRYQHVRNVLITPVAKARA